MGLEIERKFLVRSDEYKSSATEQEKIRQGYLSSVPERTVRIRTSNSDGFITIKGMGKEGGISRYEWEKKIPFSEALELLRLCEPGIIDKTRYRVPFGNQLFEVDEFHGDNDGLVVAEIELKSEEENFKHPGWLGTEVTNDERYYNAMLMKTPYRLWKKQ